MIGPMADTASLTYMNLPAIPSLNNKILSVDIGVEGIANVFTTDNEVKPITRTSIPKEIKQSVFTLFHPCLPLHKPNDKLTFDSEDLLEVDINWYAKARFTTSIYQDQYDDFLKCNTDLAFEGLLSSMENDSVNLEKIHEFMNESSIIRFMKGYFLINKSRPPCRSLSYRTKFRRWPKCLLDKYCKKRQIAHIADSLCEIPNNVLQQYLDESIFIEYDMLKGNFNARHSIVSFSTNSENYIVCPRGILMTSLCIFKIVAVDNGNEMEDNKNNLIDLIEVYSESVPYRINNICITDSLLLVHGEYTATIFDIETSNDKITIKKSYVIHLDRLIHQACFNEVNNKEVIIVNEDGGICICYDGKLVNKLDSLDSGVTCRWHACCPGNSQQTCLVSNSTTLNCLDYRVLCQNARCFQTFQQIPSKTSITNYVTLPCQYYSRNDQLSPVVQASALNPHLYYATTSESLVYIDERYTKTPLIKVNHYLKSPPQMNATLTLIDGTELVVIGNFNDRETVCLQMCGSGVVKSDFLSSFVKYNQPPVVRQPIWKFSYTNDWCKYDNDWKLSLERTENRLTSPLTGFCIPNIMQGDFSEHEQSCILVQQSLVGDLFYQQFHYGTNKGKNKVLNTNSPKHVYQENLFTIDCNSLPYLREPYKTHCMQWLNQAESLNQPSGDKKTKKKTNKAQLTEDSKFVCNYEHRSNLLANLGGTSFSLNTETLTDDLTAEKETYMDSDSDAKNIAIDTDFQTLHKQLNSVRSENKILTRHSLNIGAIDPNISLVPNPQQYTKPLSTSLRTNWENNGEYITLDNFASDLVFDTRFNAS